MAVKQEGNDDASQIVDSLKDLFSKPSLRYNQFLKKQLDQEDDFGGSISAKKLLKYKSISTHTSKEGEVIKAAKTLPDLLVVVDDKEISLKKPMKKSELDDNIPLSLCLSNLPVKDENYAVSDSDLKSLFKKYGKVTHVQFKLKIQSNDDEDDDDDEDTNKNRQKQKMNKIPSGECVIEFETAEEMTKAAKDLITGEKKKKKKGLEIKGNKIKVIKLSDYMDGKDAGPKKRKEPSPVVQYQLEWKPGCVIEIKGLDAKICDREAIKSAIGEEDSGVYADYSRGQKDGAIRFSEPSKKVKKLANKLNSGEIKICKKAVKSACLLEGDEEKAYWKKFIDFKTKQMREREDEKRTKKRKFYNKK